MSEADPKRPFPSPPESFDRRMDSARFEGGDVDLAVDMASERPSSTLHGLSPDKSTRWLVGGLVGGSLLLAAIVSLVRGDDDDDRASARNPEVVLLAPALEAPLGQAIIALELVRMEAISAHAVRAMGDAPTQRELARRAPVATPSTPAAAGTPRDAVVPRSEERG